MHKTYALKALRERLSCREIWIEGSRRHPDSKDVLPQDFEHRSLLRGSLHPTGCENLYGFPPRGIDQMPTNIKVRILRKKDGDYRISLSPFEAQAEPESLVKLKQEKSLRWSGTSLFEVLKETEMT